MGSYFYLAASLRSFAGYSRSARLKKKTRLSASVGKLVLSRRALAGLLVAMIVIMAVSYMALINIRVTKGFEIKALERKLAEIQKSQKQLEQRAAELQSIQNIEQKLDMSGFVPTTNVSYIKTGDYALGNPASPTP
ncbi:MAG: hypothetical protein M1275_00115 [Patescibacteria group bacterium]|nr:hypothetical protein [Patescibacteria group bacterium]